MMDASAYIGIPWRDRGRTLEGGTDCMGLICLIFRREFGIILPDYLEGYTSAENRAECARLIACQKAPWDEVERGQERLGDVALFRVMGHPCHVGLVLRPGVMLHQERGTNAALGWYDGDRGLRWQRRLDGLFRWRALM